MPAKGTVTTLSLQLSTVVASGFPDSATEKWEVEVSTVCPGKASSPSIPGPPG